MERIKDLSKVILRGDTVLLEVAQMNKITEGGIIIPEDKSKPNINYMTVIAKGNAVDDINVGDIALSLIGNGLFFTLNKNGVEKQYCKIVRYNLEVVVTPDNFDNSIKPLKLIDPKPGKVGLLN